MENGERMKDVVKEIRVAVNKWMVRQTRQGGTPHFQHLIFNVQWDDESLKRLIFLICLFYPPT